jgi:hypothetical protein
VLVPVRALVPELASVRVRASALAWALVPERALVPELASVLV